MPFTVDGLYLMNLTVIGVEKIASVRKSSVIREMH
jgi:hypothetical protein